MISCIILSAGLSQRFGFPKALAPWRCTNIITHLQKNLVVSEVNEIIVVLGAHAELIKLHLLKHKQVKVVYNKDYNFGQTSSFKVGLQAVSDKTTGVLLLPVDYPAIQMTTISEMLRQFRESGSDIVVPTFHGKKGHPPLFSIRLRDELLALDNDTGLNSVIHAHKDALTLFPVNDQGIISTFNTPEEFEAIKKLQ